MNPLILALCAFIFGINQQSNAQTMLDGWEQIERVDPFSDEKIYSLMRISPDFTSGIIFACDGDGTVSFGTIWLQGQSSSKAEFLQMDWRVGDRPARSLEMKVEQIGASDGFAISTKTNALTLGQEIAENDKAGVTAKFRIPGLFGEVPTAGFSKQWLDLQHNCETLSN